MTCKKQITALFIAFAFLIPSFTFIGDFYNVFAATVVEYDEYFEDTSNLNAAHPDYTYVPTGKPVYDTKDCYGKVVANPYKSDKNQTNQVYENKMDSTGIANSSSTRSQIQTHVDFKKDLTGTIHISFQYLTNELANEKMFRFFQDSASPLGASYLLGVGTAGNPNKFKYIVPGGATATVDTIAVKANTWYNFDLIINTETKTCSWSINDTKVADFSLSGTTAQNHKLRGVNIYNRTSSTGTSNSIFLDNFIVKSVTEDTTPVVVNPIEDKQMILGDTLSFDIGTVFADPKNDTLTYSATEGDITGTTYSITPLTDDEINETITATNTKNESVSTSFKIKFLKDFSYSENYDGINVGDLPSGYILNSISNADATNLRSVQEKDSNKYMANYFIRSGTSASTSGWTYPFSEVQSTGVLEFSTDVYTKGDVYEKILYLMNDTPNANMTGTDRFLTLHFTTVSGGTKVEMRVPNHNGGSKNTPLTGIVVPTDTWTKVKISVDFNNKIAHVKIGNNKPVSTTLDVTKLQVAGIATSVYYRNAGASFGSYIHLDNVNVTKKITNNPPTVSNPITDKTIKVGNTFDIDISNVFSDLDGDLLGITTNLGTISNGRLTYEPLTTGEETITLKAIDGNLGEATCSFKLTVTGNNAPTIAFPIEDKYITLGDEVSIQLADIFHDADGDQLNLVSNIGQIVGTKFIYAPSQIGREIVKITATDVENASVEDEFLIITNDILGNDVVLLYEDFETTNKMEIPSNWSVNIGAPLVPESGFMAVDKDKFEESNQLFNINHNTSDRGTLGAQVKLSAPHKGSFVASADMIFDGNVLTRYMEFLNPSNQVIFAVGFQRDSTAIRIKTSNSDFVEYPAHELKFGEKFNIRVEVDDQTDIVELFINSNYVGNYDLTRSMVADDLRVVNSILFSSYLRSAAALGHTFKFDNISYVADIQVKPEDISAVERDLKYINWDNISSEPISEVRVPLKLMDKGPSKTTISWESSNQNVIKNNGMVIRDPNEDKTVTLNAIIQKGFVKKIKSFDITVKQGTEQNVSEIFKMDFENMDIDTYPIGWTGKNDNLLHENTNLRVVADPQNSNNKVIKQTNYRKAPQSYSGYTETYKFDRSYANNIVFEAKYMAEKTGFDNMFRMYNDKGELTFSVGMGSGGSFQYNINGKNFTTSVVPLQANTWYNYRVELDTQNAFVNWYINDVLAASFKPTENLSKNYSLGTIYYYNWHTAEGLGVSYVDDVKIFDNTSARLENSLSKIDFSQIADGVFEDFDIPNSTDSEISFYWDTSDENYLKVDANNSIIKVIRPENGIGDKTVTLTAIATLNGINISRDFEIVVKEKLSDEQSVLKAKKDLLFSCISNEPQDGITTSINTITTFTEGTTITWESSDSSIIDSRGNVTRYDEDKKVKLIATITKGIFTQMKEFDLKVLRNFSANLAYRTQITEKSGEYLSNPVTYLIDENFSTAWQSLGNVDTPYVVIDLGAKQVIDSAMVSILNNVASFKVSVSNDKINYKNITSINSIDLLGEEVSTKQFNISPIEARYVKFEFTPIESNKVSVREIQIYNSKLADLDSVKLAKTILDIPNKDRIEEDLNLFQKGTHGTNVSWVSSKPEIISNNGVVTRTAQNENVTLTATITKNSVSEQKEFQVTVIANGTTMPNDPNVLTPLNRDTANMTDEEFFGVWDKTNSDWIIDKQPKIDYNYNSQLRNVGNFVKEGDYQSAKSELVNYYKTRDLDYHIKLASQDYKKSQLYAENIMFSANNHLLNTFTVPETLGNVSVDVTSSFIKNAKGSGVTLYMVQKYKHEPEVSFYSKEAGSNSAVLELTVDGNKVSLPVRKDAYISPDIHQDSNFGSDTRLYVKETKANDPNTVLGGFGNIWTKDTKRAYLNFDLSGISKESTITNATLKLYGNANGAKSDVIVWGDGNNTWRETEFNWKQALTTVFSYNGGTVDWNMPRGPEDGADNATYMNIARVVWMSTLAGCYKTSKDEFYAYHTIRQTLDMIEGTRDFIGAYNLQDAGIRAGTMIAVFNELKNSQSMTDNAAMAWIKNLWQLNYNLTLDSYFAPAHNHGVFSNRGQMRITLYFPEFADYEEYKSLFSSRWNTLASNLIKEDGSYVEATTSYTQVVANNFLSVLQEAETYGFELDSTFKNQTAQVTEYLASILYPDGTDPQYGDSCRNNHVSTIKSIDNYLDLPQVRYMYTNGKEGTHPGYTSKYYPANNKYLVLRDNYSKDAMMMQTNFGLGDKKSHTHFDNMALVAYAYGNPVLVDNGRYNYSKGEIADWIRYSTESHNVVNINDTTQGMYDDVLDSFYTNDMFDYFSGTSKSTIDENSDKFDYKRSVLFPKSKFFIVNDKITPPAGNNGTNKYDQNWHFLPKSNWDFNNETGVLKTHFSSGTDLEIAQVDKVKPVVRDGYYSPIQGTLEATKYPSFRQNKEGVVTYDTVLYPKKVGDTSTLETRRVDIGVAPDKATAYYIDILNKGSKQTNLYYKTYDAPSEKQIDNFTYNGEVMLVEKAVNNNIEGVTIVNGSRLKENEQVVLESPKNIEDLFMYYNFDKLELISKSLSFEDMEGVKLYLPQNINTVSLNGVNLSFNRTGETAEIESSNNTGADNIPVSSITIGKEVFKQGTTVENYITSIAFDNVLNATLNIPANVTMTGENSWAGNLPKLSISKSASVKVDGEVRNAIKMSQGNITYNKPYTFQVKVPAGYNYGIIKDGVFTPLNISPINGYLNISETKDIEFVIYKKFVSPPGSSTGGGGGGGPVDPKPTDPPIPTDPPTPTNPPKIDFKDIENHWAYEAIVAMYEKGVIKGKTSTEFVPEETVTRAEFAAMITRLLGLKEGASGFKDVNESDWFNGSVGAVSKAGIMNGSNNEFRPYDSITREEIVKVLVTAYEKEKGEIKSTPNILETYEDKNEISFWATGYMEKALTLSLISGVTKTTLEPKENATRAQSAVLFNRLSLLIK